MNKTKTKNYLQTGITNVLFILMFSDLEEAMHVFDEAKKAVTTCQYDYLDYRNNEFDKDHQAFEEKTNALRESIGNTIENNFASVWETPQGIKFLTRFEKVCLSAYGNTRLSCATLIFSCKLLVDVINNFSSKG